MSLLQDILARASRPTKQNWLTASAVLGFLQLSMGAMAGLAIGRLHDGTPVPMTLAITVLAAQNAQGFAVLETAGHAPPVNAVTAACGLGSLVAASVAPRDTPAVSRERAIALLRASACWRASSPT